MTQNTTVHPTEETKPYPYSALFWRVILIFAALETVIPWLSYPTFRPDIYEAISVGRQWVIATFKHPALTTWIANIFWQGTGHAPFAPYLASAFCTGVTIWAVWRLSREYLDSKRALFGALLLTAYWYCNLGNAVFNNNVTLTMFWYLAILTFHFALVRKKVIYWILCGLAIGSAMLCKYPAICIAGTLALYLLATPNRRALKTAGPWLGVFFALLVFLPNGLFLLDHYAEQIQYATTKAASDHYKGMLLSGWIPQFGIISPLIISLFPLIYFSRKKEKKPSNESPALFTPDQTKTGAGRYFLLTIFLLPILLMILAQLISGVPFYRRAYGYPLWLLTGLCLLYYLPIKTEEKYWRSAVTLMIIFAIGELVSVPVQSTNNYFFVRHRSQKFYPAAALCAEVDALWSEKYDTPCSFACGDFDPRFMYSVYSRFHPQTDSYGYAAWNTADDIQRAGGVLLWETGQDDGSLPQSAERFPNAYFVTYIEKPWLQRSPEVIPARWGVAFIPPSKSSNGE